jgi:hypothetical protein
VQSGPRLAIAAFACSLSMFWGSSISTIGFVAWMNSMGLRPESRSFSR